MTQLTSIQENLGKINELIREKMILDEKNVKVLEDIDKMLEGRNERYEEEAKLRKEATEEEQKRLKIIDELEKREKAISDIKKAAWAGAAAGAISALGTTINTVFKAGKIAVEAFIDVMKKVGTAAFNIGKSLLMLPWNMFKSLVSAAANAQGSTELLDRIEDIRKEWGSFSNAMSADVLKASTLGINLKQGAVAQMQFYKETLAPGRSMMRVWQSLPEMMKDITKTLSSLGPTINLVMNQFSNPQTFRSIVAMKKGLGLADDEFKALAEHTMANGKKIEDSMYEIGNLSLQLGDKFGLSSKKISSDVGKMMKDLGNFGNLTEKQMTAAATQFNRLGVEISKVTGMMDKFDQFEEAADASSKLSQAFGLQVDSMELMRAEDPAERQQMLADAMNRAGVSTDGMRKQSLKLLATTMGLDAATTKTMFSSANLGKSYNEVKNAADEASQKQLSQEEVLKRLADAIEKVNRTGNQLKDGFFKTFLDGIEKGIMRTPSYINMMTNLRRGLYATLHEGLKTGESITKTLGLDDMFNAIGNHFSKENMTKFFGKNGMRGAIEIIFNPKSSKEAIDQAFNDIINAFTNQKDGLMSKIYPQLQKLGDIFGKIGQLIITKIGEAIGNAFKGGAKLLKGNGLVQNLSDEFKNSPWGKFIMPVWDGLKSAFLSMFDGFAELAPVLLEKVLKSITWIFKGIEYLLASKEQRKALDATSATGSYLSFDTTKKKGALTEFDKTFDKLSSGVTAVFNDDKIWNPLKEALSSSWEELKNRFKSAWDFVAPYIKTFLAANLVLKVGTGALVGAAGGFAKEFTTNEAFRKSITGGLSNLVGSGTFLGGMGKGFGLAKTAVMAPLNVVGGIGSKVVGGIVNSRAVSAIGGAIGQIGTLMTKLPVVGGLFEKLGSSVGGIFPAAGIALAAFMSIKAAMNFSDTKEAALKAFKERDDVVNAETTANVAGFLNILTLGLMSPEMVQNLSVQFMNLMNTIIEKLNDFLPGFGNFVEDLFGGMTDALGGMIDAWGSLFNDLFDPDMGIFDAFSIGIRKLFFNALDGILKMAKPFLSWIPGLGGAIESLGKATDEWRSNLEKEREATRAAGEKAAREKVSDIKGLQEQYIGLSGKEQKEIASTVAEMARFEKKRLEAIAKGQKTVAIDEKILKQKELQADVFKKAIENDKKLGISTEKLQEALNKLNSDISSSKSDLEKAKVREKHPGATTQSSTTSTAENAATTATNTMPVGSGVLPLSQVPTNNPRLSYTKYGMPAATSATTPPTTPQGATAQQAESSAQQGSTEQQGLTPQQRAGNSRVQALTEKIEETKTRIEETKGLISTSNDNVKKIVDTNSDITINTQAIVVNLKNNHDALMEGINSIRTSTRNVNVQVAVAVELNVKDLEKAIVKQNDSLIRKAVSIIENNISPTSKPNTSEKPVSRGGDIATEAFDKGT